ncbi:hypothetical protein HC776_01820 [bacterium]|nr:hypothetical protein [bacterium]
MRMPLSPPAGDIGTQIARGEFGLNETEVAAVTLTALAAGQGGGEATPTPEGVSDVGAVQATATALAQILQTQAVSTIAVVTPQGGGATSTPRPDTDLPETGFFDDVGGSGGMFLLMGLGLLGVILVTRGLRTAGSRP